MSTCSASEKNAENRKPRRNPAINGNPTDFDEVFSVFRGLLFFRRTTSFHILRQVATQFSLNDGQKLRKVQKIAGK